MPDPSVRDDGQYDEPREGHTGDERHPQLHGHDREHTEHRRRPDFDVLLHGTANLLKPTLSHTRQGAKTHPVVDHVERWHVEEGEHEDAVHTRLLEDRSQGLCGAENAREGDVEDIVVATTAKGPAEESHGEDASVVNALPTFHHLLGKGICEHTLGETEREANAEGTGRVQRAVARGPTAEHVLAAKPNTARRTNDRRVESSVSHRR